LVRLELARFAAAFEVSVSLTDSGKINLQVLFIFRNQISGLKTDRFVWFQTLKMSINKQLTFP